MQRRLAPALLLLFAGVVAVYAPSLGAGFLYDDHDVIAVQPPPRSPGDLARVFAEPHFRGLPYYRPVTRLSLLTQKGLHGDRPGAFRLANAALMGAAALLAFAVMRTPALATRRGPVVRLLLTAPPIPSCPSSWSPQQRTVPSATAQVENEERATSVTFSSPGTFTGASIVSSLPSPSFPCSPEPQQ